MDPAPVYPFCSRLLRVKHHTAADRVEGVVERCGDAARNGGTSECGHGAQHTRVFLVRVHVHDLRKEAELATTVDEGACDSNSRTSVKASDATLLHRFRDAIDD